MFNIFKLIFHFFWFLLFLINYIVSITISFSHNIDLISNITTIFLFQYSLKTRLAKLKSTSLSFDIINLFTKAPVDKFLHIIRQRLESHNSFVVLCGHCYQFIN